MTPGTSGIVKFEFEMAEIQRGHFLGTFRCRKVISNPFLTILHVSGVIFDV
jgi:hypothetical protein